MTNAHGERHVGLHRADQQGDPAQRHAAPLRCAARVSEAIRVGQALGYELEEVHHIDPEIIAKAGEGDAAATREYDEHRLAEVNKAGGGEHRPSMGQDMVKGRRTEIEFLNGFIVRKGEGDRHRRHRRTPR